MGGLYIHTPFCHSKCAYCDFFSTPNLAALPHFANAIAKEWALRKDEIAEPYDTLYFGGGTPSMLPIGILGNIISALPDGQEEVTIEANPEDVDADHVKAWIGLGINRVSMGVQSFDDAELRIIGRRHTSADAIKASETLFNNGISNFSLDLIYGLPGQSLESWGRSLQRLFSIRPAHFSAYILSYEPGTRLWAMRKAGKVEETPESVILEMYAMLADEARAHGYDHYEISNFSLPGMRSRHNSAYWTGAPYLGLGPSAHSFDGATRRINPSNLMRYLSAISDGATAFEIDVEDDDNRFNDRIITSMRTKNGIDATDIPAERRFRLMKDALPLIGQGYIVSDGGYLRIPERHWPIADSIMAELMQI